MEEAEDALDLIAARFFTPYPLLCGVVGILFETAGGVVVISFPSSFPFSSRVVVPSPFSPLVIIVAKFFDSLLEAAGAFTGVVVGDDDDDDDRSVSFKLVSN